ncbi:MAG: DNA replication/repair protein RecF [Eubacteriales bacterium]|nr:DNA replication/repair protein RecF [Eubacteriales bacterium]
MYVESIQLSNYRNYDSADIIFSPGVNIFFGDNAQGKTNLLEAVYLSGTSRSHRGSRDNELIRFDKNEAHIRLFFNKKQLSHRLDFHLKKKKARGIAIDGVPIKKTGELLGMLHIVFFSPEDLSMIKNGPSMRRRFLDMEMSQLDRAYLQYVTRYSKLLVERNNLLKQIAVHPQLKETLDGWDEQLVELGRNIIKKREAFVIRLDEMMREIHGNLTGGKENMQVFYEKNTGAEELRDALWSKRDRDIKMGATSVGPHRDDIAFQSNGIDIRKFGSQGQQRTAALALKLSEIRLIEKVSGEKPVLLLDDVLSELDSHRQNYLLEHISDIQTMISCTGLEEFVNARLSMDKIFRVDQGKIKEYQ